MHHSISRTTSGSMTVVCLSTVLLTYSGLSRSTRPLPSAFTSNLPGIVRVLEIAGDHAEGNADCNLANDRPHNALPLSLSEIVKIRAVLPSVHSHSACRSSPRPWSCAHGCDRRACARVARRIRDGRTNPLSQL